MSSTTSPASSANRAARRPRRAAAGRAGSSGATARPGRPPRRSWSGSRWRLAASCWAEPALVTIAPVSGSRRGHSSMIRPSKRARSSASGSQTSTTARPPGPRWSASAWRARPLGGPGRQHEQRVERDEREAEPAGVGQPQADEVGFDEGQAIRSRRRPRARRRARSSIAGSRSTPVTSVAGLGQRDRQPAGPDGQLEDRAIGPIGQREIQVEVARVVGQVEVVQARERRRGRGIGSVEHRPGQLAPVGVPWLVGNRSAGMVSPPSGRACRRPAGRPAR